MCKWSQKLCNRKFKSGAVLVDWKNLFKENGEKGE